MTKLSGLFLPLLILFGSPAAATTYYYVGNPYAINSVPTDFGTNMVGSVTFDFDTSTATGTYYLSDGVITDLQLTSGVYSVDATSFYSNTSLASLTYFILNSGAITGWQFPTSRTDPIFQSWSNCLCADPTSSSDGIFVAMSAQPGPAIYAANYNSPGVWTVGLSPAPAPPNPILTPNEPASVATTPLPGSLPLLAAGLGLLGLFGWRKRKLQTV